MRRLKRTAGLVFLALLMSACTSLSPQQVELQPLVDTRQRLPGGLSVALEAKDLRPTPVIGYRVSRFEQNAFITLARDARYTLLSTAQQALRQMGAYRFAPSVSGANGLKISLLLDRLSYDASQHSVRQEVRLDMALRLVAEYRGRAFTGQYQSQKTHSSPLPPSEAKNQELLNDLASETLTRAFNDPKLIEFLRRGG
ncbi:hypothetical protein GCM10011348_19240 [Marinobacterium nitratireducens]|uniref:Lipoprotein n=1 Tax=Marinobacterium nitratireducens TaxID=518897 RepID=A0A918DRY1_9GAMM|nr:YajG family lipoprotein [Marinobacterium nitratireducens]GGO81071.1 hypothetical protein GCM10011348_19240 [Marinobacterium nitratireducens]